MATIKPYELGTGSSARERTRYRVVYRRPDGKQTSKSGFKTKREAELFVASVEVSKAKGEYVSPSDGAVPVGALADGWLRRKKALLKTSAYQPLESSWRNHVRPVWGEVAVKDVHKSDVQVWVAELLTGSIESQRKPLGATSVIRAHEVLAGILENAVTDRLILVNPVRGVDLPRKTRKPNVYLSHDDVFRLAGLTGRPELVLTLAYTGIRWGEAAGLQVKHVNFERRRLSIERNLVEVQGGKVDITTPKNGKSRSVPFPAFLEPHLREMCKAKLASASVFTEPDGGTLKRPNSRRGWFVSAVRKAGLEHLTPHDLRHSAASFAVSSGAHVKAVQRMLGHQSAAMTLDRYADLFDGDLDNVASALDSLVSLSGARLAVVPDIA